MVSTDPDGHDISILYVEDDPHSRKKLSDIIRKRYPGVRYFVAENGETGIESFILHRHEIVITDINMPVSGGIEMAAEIKTLSPSTEIIALTAFSEAHYLLQAIEIGFSYYILKPINIEKLFGAIDKALATIRSKRLITRQNDMILNLNHELFQKTIELELKNKELESFDYTVAHDLRTPMNNISGISRKLLDVQALKSNNDCHGYLQAIEREITIMNGIVSALLKLSVFSRRMHVEKKWTNLSKIVHEICEKLQKQDPQHHVMFCIAEDVYGYCDPDLLRIVLNNLLENAWKYKAKRNHSRIEFGTINKKEDLVYFIRDNGIGFDQQEARRIFIPFQRLQCADQHEGSGIGLATAFRIIQRHEGRIWAVGEKGKEAVFYFTL